MEKRILTFCIMDWIFLVSFSVFSPHYDILLNPENEEKMMELMEKAGALLAEFKDEDYIYGVCCLERSGDLVKPFGNKVLVLTHLHERDPSNFERLYQSLLLSDLDVEGPLPSARPNSPNEDVSRIKDDLLQAEPEAILIASGGSGIDAVKAAIILATLGGDINDYFGSGRVSEELRKREKELIPFVAVQTASSSAAHLTRYSNITDLQTLQKKLIADDAVIPAKALFDYSLTQSMSPSFTVEGAFDGLAHCLEVYYGAQRETMAKIQEIALLGIELIVTSLKKSIAEPSDMEARKALGLATDLGGYAIMVGGTNGAHLNSFSLVDILSHGRACAILNPYYTVFFSPAIQEQLKNLAHLFARHGLMSQSSSSLKGEELGLAVAQALINLSLSVDFPTTLGQVQGMSRTHIEKSLHAAKDPQLEMKLKNMPVSLTSDMVNEYMRPILEAALSGDFSLIKTI